MRRALRGLLGVLGAIAACAAAVDVYARLPLALDVEPLAVPAGTRTLVVLFHGRGGQDEPTLGSVEQRFDDLARGEPGTVVIRYVWAPYSDQRLRAGVNGATVGAALGRQVAALEGLRYIHLVGHSAGAYPVAAFCRAYRDSAAHPARVAVTYLDPIGFAGAFDAGWGARSYGECGDYVEAIINTDDPVPATNVPLQHAWNLDVTRAPDRDGGAAAGHRWPVRWYLRHLGAEDLDDSTRDNVSRPRGVVATP
jgi:hypothetical protein